MRYLSVCSGIEAASVAWHHLGWTPVGFSEIEPFPAAVLAHRFPNVPNYGDMTKYEQWPLQPGSIDVLVGGTPCQSYSVAGLRHGLADPRGSLMLTYLAIAARLRPRWIVWENVPGVLSSNGGRDFGTFLGALGELGYGFAYRVLDAQYVRVGRWPRAVPQRRRRVFVVGRLLERGTGDGAAAAEVLALREGLQRHLEASGKTRKGAAADAEGGTRGGCWWDGGQVSQTLDAVLSKRQTMPEKNRFPAVLQPTEVSGTIAARFGQSRNNHEECVVQPTAGTLGNRGLRSHTELDGHGAYIPVAQPVPYDLFQITAPVNRQNRKPGDPCHTLARDNAAHAAIAIQGNLVGRETGGPQGVGASTDGAMYTLTKADTHAVAFNFQGGSQQDQILTGNSVSPALAHASNSHGGHHQPKLFQQVAHAMTVRRLTPVECERLQGFPDNWTAIPWRKKPAEECPDGPRYKALGNSMACNCMALIGERIAAYEQRGRVDPTPAGTAGIAPAGDLNHEGDRHG